MRNIYCKNIYANISSTVRSRTRSKKNDDFCSWITNIKELKFYVLTTGLFRIFICKQSHVADPHLRSANRRPPFDRFKAWLNFLSLSVVISSLYISLICAYQKSRTKILALVQSHKSDACWERTKVNKMAAHMNGLYKNNLWNSIM